MEVGDYVRTKDGCIAKITSKEKNPYGEETIFVLDKEINIYDLELSDMYLIENPLAKDTTNKIDTHFEDEKIIKKSSPNIIDLIEAGDYVNSVRVDEIVYIGHGKSEDLEIAFRYKYALEKDDVYTLKEKDIKSIVTKEQFEEMEYKIND